MKEANVLAALERRLKSLDGCVFIKVHGSPFQPAALDIVGCYRSVPFTVETKRPGGKPTPRQEALLIKWAGCGALTDVVDSSESASRFVETLRRLGDERMRYAS